MLPVAAWYSGLYEERDGLATISLANALLWDALDFTKPPDCGWVLGRRALRLTLSMADIEADVIVVGSGISGALLAAKLLGNDPKSSVVDRDLRSHDHRNLFILGSAVFPTGATANPTLTIAALASRSAGSVKVALTQ